MAENFQIFNGGSSATPDSIREALGGMECADEDAIPNLIGAVMTLCNRVAELEAQVSHGSRAQEPSRRDRLVLHPQRSPRSDNLDSDYIRLRRSMERPRF